MPRMWFVPVFCVFFSVIIVMSQQTAPQPAANPAHIEGVVLDGKTGMPLSGVSIGTGTRMTTGDDGRFALDIPIQPQCLANVAANCSVAPPTLNATKPGYMAARPEGRKLPGSPGIPITLTAGQHFDNLVIRLNPVATVVGRVSDPAGQPLQDASVIPFRLIYNDAGTRVRQNYPEAKTNDLGDFRMNNLDSGDYFFEIRPEPIEFGPPGSVLSPTYYPGVVDSTKAMPVHIEGGIRNQMNSVSVLSVRGGTLRLHVVNEAGEAPRGTTIVGVSRKGEASVTVLSPPMIPREVISEVVELGRLVPGAYDIRANFATYGAPGSAEGRASFVTSESDTVVEVLVRKPVPTPIHGKAVTEASSNREPRLVQGVQLGLVDFSASSPNINIRTLPLLWTSQGDGTFPDRNGNVNPGFGVTYRVKVLMTPPGMAVVSIRDGDLDVLKDGLRVEAGKSPNVVVTLAENAGKLTGTASDGNGQKIIGGIVALLPDDAQKAQLLTATSTDLNGEFRFQVPPGPYHLYAWRELDGAAYYDPGFMKPYIDKGTAARVPANSEVKVDVKIVE